MNRKKGSAISRREFARRAAMVSAASLVAPTSLPLSGSAAPVAPQQATNPSKLSPESQADAESRYQAIMSAYGSRFSDAQKSDVRRLCVEAQPALDRLRAYKVENGDGPALYLKPLVEREKKAAGAASGTAKTGARS
jgi:hypothetical protein